MRDRLEFFKTPGFLLRRGFWYVAGWESGNLLVSDLITASGGWNENLVGEVFDEEDRVAILNIPLVVSQAHDIMVWHYIRNGRYSVKSGYWLAMKEKRQVMGGVADHVPVSMDYWKHLWKLKVPPSLLHFLWRGSMGFIPCMEALHWKRIVSSALCFRCQQTQESILHATWSCGLCVAVLERLRFYSVLASNQFSSLSLLVDFAVKNLAEHELQLLIILLWMNWRRKIMLNMALWYCYRMLFLRRV